MGELEQSTLEVVNRLATVLRDMGRLDEAEKLAMSSAELYAGGGKGSSSHPTMYRDCSVYQIAKAKAKRPSDMFRLSLACNERILGKGHPITLRTVVKIASLLYDQEYYDEATDMHRRTAGLENYFGPDHPEVIDEVQHSGELMRAEVIPEAEALLRRALAGSGGSFQRCTTSEDNG